MRAGAAVSAPPSLSPESASALKHSLGLARRRGHAQVTPLHVAATLLSSSASLLRAACLKSQPHPPSHPLQCRALELCFNVALNRLPAAPAAPSLHRHAQLPSLSNALIAALKRAQAHQRRGCIEQQQNQPIIAIKVELEQLIVSILDDPSVSRVMKEAGFSSTAVKATVENCSSSLNSVFGRYSSSGGIYSAPNFPPSDSGCTNFTNPNFFWNNPQLPHSPNFHNSKPAMKSFTNSPSFTEEIKLILGVLLGNKKRNTVIVGDSTSMAESLVSDLTAKIDSGDVPDGLKSAKLFKFQLSSLPLRFMSRHELDTNLADLKRKVESQSYGRVIVYVGDLQWAADNGGQSDGFSAVDHLIAEIGKLLHCWCNSGGIRVWLMAAANYQTYMKCKMRKPLMDTEWDLQPVSIPFGGLGLSLNGTSGLDSRITLSQIPSQITDKRLLFPKEEQDVLTCCQECISNYEKDAVLKSIHQKSFAQHKDKQNGSSCLPFWVKPDHDKDELLRLTRKYNKMCQSLHQGSQNGRDSYAASPYFCWPDKNVDETTFVHRKQQRPLCQMEFDLSNGSSKYRSNLDSITSMEGNEMKITLALGIDQVEEDLADMLKENIPWQVELIPSIVEALMDGSDRVKFLLIQGNDVIGKRRLALGIAKGVSGSSDLLFSLNMRNNVNPVSENCQMLEKALQSDDKLVVLVEDVDWADPEFVMFLADIVGGGKRSMYRRHAGRAIFILTTDSDVSCNKAGEDVKTLIKMKLVVQEPRHSSKTMNLDLKRKVKWDGPMRGKRQRSNETEEVSSDEKRGCMKPLSRYSLDLNIRADMDEDDDDDDDEEEEEDDNDEVSEAKLGDLSPISSDLTRDTTLTTRQHSTLVNFLKTIRSCFVLNMDSDQHEHAKQMLLSKFKRAYDEANGCSNAGSFHVEESVLDEVVGGSGTYLNGVFDDWLRDVFGASLGMVRERGKVSVRVCMGGRGESCEIDGFKGTCLPERIPICFIV